MNTLSSNGSMSSDDTKIVIGIMGATGTGKTSFINLVSGSTLRVGTGLQSCTNVVQMSKPFELDGRSVTLIDTPGFDDTTRSDTDVLKTIAAFLATEYENGRKLAGVIYFHRISDFRMGGISRRNLQMFQRLCGDDTMANVVILTNMWGEVSREVGEAREAQLASQDLFFKPILSSGARLLRHYNTIETGHSVLRNIIHNHPLALCIQRELVDQGLDISHTSAGKELLRGLMEQAERYQEEMRILQEELDDAIAERDEEMKNVLEAETAKLQGAMTRIQTDSQNLGSDYKEEKARLGGLIPKMNGSSGSTISSTGSEETARSRKPSSARGIELMDERQDAQPGREGEIKAEATRPAQEVANGQEVSLEGQRGQKSADSRWLGVSGIATQTAVIEPDTERGQKANGSAGHEVAGGQKVISAAKQEIPKRQEPSAVRGPEVTDTTKQSPTPERETLKGQGTSDLARQTAAMGLEVAGAVARHGATGRESSTRQDPGRELSKSPRREAAAGRETDGAVRELAGRFLAFLTKFIPCVPHTDYAGVSDDRTG